MLSTVNFFGYRLYCTYSSLIFEHFMTIVLNDDLPTQSDNTESHHNNEAPRPQSRQSDCQNDDSDEPLLKKPRLEEYEPPAITHTETNLSPFLDLPLELLAEILILTESPKHILTVARSCKVLCTTLLDPSSAFIWRTARNICKPEPLPEPFQIFTEASYAAFVFDGGRCEMCKNKTDLMYTSFALRLRLCHRMECVVAFFERSAELLTMPVGDQAVIKRVPHVENSRCFYPRRYVRTQTTVFRQTDWFMELYRRAEAGNPETYIANSQSKVKFISEWMEFCKALFNWKDLHRGLYLYMRNVNERSGKDLAKRHGWEFRDLISCTPFGAIHRRRSCLLECVTERDYNLLATEIDKIMVKLTENRKRRDHEAAYKQNRDDIEQHYNRLRSQQLAIILPPIAAFRKLPIIAMLQASPTTAEISNVSQTLQATKWVGDQLDAELKQWVENAKAQLGAILGHPNWKTSSKVILHPCDRITARFRCKNCPRLPLKNISEGCLDFAGACVHECVGMSNVQKRHQKAWDPDKFVKDDKASAVMLQLLGLCGADETYEESRPLIEELGLRIICSSCEPPLLMGPESIVGHCHRHNEMKISLLPTTETKSNFEIGLVRRLLGPLPKAKTLQAMKTYGCRHCENQPRQDKRRPRTSQKPVETQETDLSGSSLHRAHDSNPTQHVSQTGHNSVQASKHTSAFTFNGLRSHLSAKHNIKDIRDEDLFCYEPLDWTPVRTAQ